MSDINNLYWNPSRNAGGSTSSTNNATAPIGSNAKTTAPKKELDQASFMKLLTMQLSYQDPFKPVDNAQMLSQMASMSTSEGISSLSTQMGKLNEQMISSQALQASSLVGQNVLLQSSTGFLDKEGSLTGVVAVGTTNKYASVKITVEDEKGQVIKEFPLDGGQMGNVEIAWDGTDKDGKRAPSGKYVLKASGNIDGKSESITTFAYGKVESVALGTAKSPTRLNLKGLGGEYLNNILQVSGINSNQTTTSSKTTSTSSI